MHMFKAVKYHIKYHIFKTEIQDLVWFCHFFTIILHYFPNTAQVLFIGCTSVPYNEACGNRVGDATNTNLSGKH